MSAPLRRGTCPSLSKPMPSGDGLIARLHPAGGLTPDQLRTLCNAAETFGNGLMEVTQRGNLQFRGLTRDSASGLAEAVNRTGIPSDDGVPISVSPLAVLDPMEIDDPRPLAATIRQALATEPLALAPKVSVVVDGGGIIDLATLQADIRLEALSADRWLVSAGGDRTGARRIGTGTPDMVAQAAVRLLREIASRGPAARGRELVDVELIEASALLDAAPPALPARPVKSAVGLHPLRDGHAILGFGVPFGATAVELGGLALAAPERRVAEFRFAPGRTVLALLPAAQAASLAEIIEALGFVTDPTDPRLHVAACAGRPACASAWIAARALAPAVAEAARPLLDGSTAIHLSGCAKGCAHPGPAALAFVGGVNGVGLVVGGTASAAPSAHVAEEGIAAAAARVAARVRAAARPGETAAATIARLGAEAAGTEAQRTPTAA